MFSPSLSLSFFFLILFHLFDFLNLNIYLKTFYNVVLVSAVTTMQIIPSLTSLPFPHPSWSSQKARLVPMSLRMNS